MKSCVEATRSVTYRRPEVLMVPVWINVGVVRGKVFSSKIFFCHGRRHGRPGKAGGFEEKRVLVERSDGGSL